MVRVQFLKPSGPVGDGYGQVMLEQVQRQRLQDIQRANVNVGDSMPTYTTVSVNTTRDDEAVLTKSCSKTYDRPAIYWPT